MSTTDPNEEVITTPLTLCCGGFEYRSNPVDGRNDELIFIVSCIIVNG